MSNDSYLIEPLLERAVASAYLPAFGFIDRAAELLIDNLGVAPTQYERALRRLRQDSRTLLRCKWIDDQLQAFFTEHPEGTAVEIGAGFSTRFHRLSYAEDWPKFSWLSVDSSEVVQSVSHCFPSIDNYTYCESEMDNTGWLLSLSKSKRSPFIVVIENPELISETGVFKRLCQAMLSELGHVHLVVDLSVQELRGVEKTACEDFSLRSFLALCSTRNTFLNRISPFKRYSGVEKRHVCHLVLGKEPA